jgi:hypothetical protein
MEKEDLLEDYEAKYLKEGSITLAEYLSLKKQDEIIERLHKIIMRLDGLEILAKYRR